MATHDYVIANGTGAAVRSDLNNALAAIVSNNSGSSEPSTTYAYQWWADTTANVLKIRNSANNAWITLRELDGTMLMEDGSASSPGLSFASDLDTGLFRTQANQISFATGGVERLKINNGEAVFNEVSNDVDFRVESNGNTHMLFVDGGNDRVGIGQVPTRELSLHSPDNNNSYIHFTNDDTGETASDGALVGIDGNEDLNINNQESSKNIILRTGGSERLRLDSDGRLLLGTAGGRAVGGGTQAIAQIETTSQNGLTFVAHRGTNTSGSILVLGKSRGTSVGSSTIVAENDELGALRFAGADGSDVQSRAASIAAFVDGTPGSNDMPGRLVFSTTADSASSPTERLRIDSAGMVELRANQGTAETNIIRFTDTDTSVAASQKFGQLQWFSNDASGGGPSVKGEIYVVARDTTPDGDMVFATHDGSGTNTAENIRLISEGGLTFNGDTATANALDDYEEGTFTPVYSTGITSPGYTATSGSYTKIGNCVTFTLRIYATSGTNNSSQVAVGGLPFTSSSSLNQGGAFFNYRHDLNSTNAGPFLHISQNGTDIVFFNEVGGSWVGTNGSGLLNRTLHIQGHYYV